MRLQGADLGQDALGHRVDLLLDVAAHPVDPTVDILIHLMHVVCDALELGRASLCRASLAL